MAVLLQTLDPNASLVQRHLWLIALLGWVRGSRLDASTSVLRVEYFLDALDARPSKRAQMQDWWRMLITDLDLASLLSDYGFATRNSFITELIERLHGKLFPSTPETRDGGELFALALTRAGDAQWIAALSPVTRARLAGLLSVPAAMPIASSQRPLTHWQNALIEAITFCTSQIRAAGFSPDLRLRMHFTTRESNPFHTLTACFEAVRDAWLQGGDAMAEMALFRSQLDLCRQATTSVYNHLDEHGISMDLVFRLRQIRERMLRIRSLLDCLLNDSDHQYSARLLSQMAGLGLEQRSIGALLLASSSVLAAKVTERSSETGEHYITRTRAEYVCMLRDAAGGGALTALTTAGKFGVMSLGLSAFWFGYLAGVVYAVSFVVIQLLHFTLATKQPAMTAPAMAAKLQDLKQPGALELFVDEVTHLVRSQVAAVIGNVVVVFPVVIVLSLLMERLWGLPMVDAHHANQVMESLSLFGPSLLFAAFTGVLLFVSSLVGGWVENWFVLHRLQSALRYNPRIGHWLGADRAMRWAHFMRQQISGFASNISLGFMLGLVPPILAFVGLGLDVRHITLSTGQLGAAAASLGWGVLQQNAWWWAVACIPLIGMLNVGVSFYLAFRVALRALNVGREGRQQIYQAIRQRLRRAPMSFFFPAREDVPAAKI
ncbi:recombinase [Limnohabitans sp. T6-5]|uniref:site-specific recombinase n=1 Tax=Limnohabitans sp. T6-5 TaxID=1100724 RepID=UPI000D38F93A|nr:site-specific recombinase [Limnohabitans sp. T6-5]PUE10854.1 recombinase [Limnohabitans sp. T6-5]